MNITKEKISSLEISDELKADILSLFGAIETKESELEKLRAKAPTDSQKIVESIDYDKFIRATAELAELKKTMAEKLEEKGVKQAALSLRHLLHFSSEP